ncbi:hypothetical protein [Halodesulfovibrio spirochaetisodalis]|uniref:Poly A polymerase head domain-containing protein n=1 Tax=Halodesulfovibrio spirochaetisodalis TaxID=1560234 RepID=A0A1B7XMM9_9BACT|nr:hypothetical protein [Halodesulfovibrio spirochaetisodalis]OBQ56761.1 hypothetical protein SP90_01360 [Halodesulfovibrio spirochaetisodalis]
MLSPTEHLVTNALESYIYSRKDVSTFLDHLSTYGKIYIFGGVIRDLAYNAFHHDNVVVSDIDVIIDTEDFVPPYGEHTRNSFGGYKFQLPNDTLDVWRIKDTLAVKKSIVQNKIESIPKSTVFTANSIIIEWPTGNLFQDGFFDALSQRQITFQCKDYLELYPELQALRAVTYVQKLGFTLTKDVHDFVARTVRKQTESMFRNKLKDTAKRGRSSVIKSMFNDFA